MKNKLLFSIFTLICVLFFFGFKPKFTTSKIKPVRVINLKFREPSDICRDKADGNYFMPVDKASIVKINSDGKEIFRSSFQGYDLEGLCLHENKLYVSDETFRTINVFETQPFKLSATYSVPYGGAANKGYEGITFDDDKNIFILATEKSPQFFQVMSPEFQPLERFTIEGINEVSALCYHNKFLWILSDEQMTVFKTDAISHTISGAWKIPVINPEGISFNEKGEMLIVSDDMNKLFIFKQPDL